MANSEELEHINCNNCGIHFCISKTVVSLWRESHKPFMCPNGHGLSYSGKSASEKELEALQKEVKELREKVKSLQAIADSRNLIIEDLKTRLELWEPRPEKG